MLYLPSDYTSLPCTDCTADKRVKNTVNIIMTSKRYDANDDWCRIPLEYDDKTDDILLLFMMLPSLEVNEKTSWS